MLVPLPKYQAEPEFCPLHEQPGPCLACLGPEVLAILERERIPGVTYFVEPSVDVN